MDEYITGILGIECIKDHEETLALIIRREAISDSVCFLTPADYPFQLGLFGHTAGHRIRPHAHPRIERHTDRVMEYLLIQRGAVRVELYSERGVFVKSVTLRSGDSILLIGGGHGFEVLEDTQMLEVKQGPYLGQELTKTFLNAVESQKKDG